MLVLLSKLLNASSCAAIFLARRKLTFETVQGYIHIFFCKVLKSKTRRMVTQGDPTTHLFHRALKRKTSFKILSGLPQCLKWNCRKNSFSFDFEKNTYFSPKCLKCEKLKVLSVRKMIKFH